MEAPEGECCTTPNCCFRPRWRCVDCFERNFLCTKCCRDNHKSTPFHRIEKWTGTHFSPAWLMDTGYVLNVGHCGARCPTPATGSLADYGESEPDDEEWELDEELQGLFSDDRPVEPPRKDEKGRPILVIVDRGGVHCLPVRFCTCPSPDSHWLQLLKLGLLPASFKKPRTAFTFSVLDDYHIDNLECKTTFSAYYRKKQKVTSPGFPDSVPVSSCHLI